MIQPYWEKASGKIDELTLRERVLIFAAAAFLLVSLIDVLFLEPLLAKQKLMSTQVVQQQEKMKAIQLQITALLQSQQSIVNSPVRRRMEQLKREIAAGEDYIKGRSNRLVPPQQMAGVLQKMLRQDEGLQLVSLKTLPVTPLLDESRDKTKDAAPPPVAGRQVFKHGVVITVRGRYLDLLAYLDQLEHLPAQMFWGGAKLDVEKYPQAELTLTLYTLSLDKKWLTV